MLKERGSALFLIGGALVAALYLVIPDGMVRDSVYVLVELCCAGGILLGVRMHRPALRSPWFLVALCFLIWSVGDGYSTFAAATQRVTPFPAPSNVIFLTGYPVLVVALALFVRSRQRMQDTAGLIDSSIVTAGLALLSWVLLVNPVLHDDQQQVFSRAVSIGYVVFEIGVFCLLFHLMTFPGIRSPAFRMLIIATLLLPLADIVFATVGGSPGLSAVPDVIWIGGYVLWAAAALHPSMASITRKGPERPTEFTSWRLAALAVAVLIAPGIFAFQLAVGADIQGWTLVTGSVVLIFLGGARMYVALRDAVSADHQRRQLQGDLEHQAAHDSLTGLPNRAYVLELIESAMHRGRRGGTLVGLLFIDLDYFKLVNDSRGHRVGDEVLRVVAQRMRSLIRSGDTVGRLGGDEFVVVVESLTSLGGLTLLAERLIAAVSEPIPASGSEVVVSASVGIAADSDGGTNASDLLHEADVAAYRAKAKGRGRAEVFDDTLRRELDERRVLETAIRAGILLDEFVLHYQPVVIVDTGVIEGYEALVRWQRPGHGLVYPDAFIPTAEESELISELDRWVLHRATAQLAQWRTESPALYENVTMAVNISGRHLTSSTIAGDVADALQASELPANRLVVEITETVLVDEPTASVRLSALRRLGVTISIDDFGTGYTSIGQLQNLEVDVLKIDRSFIDTNDPATHALVRLMIDAAHAFNLVVVAEGVELIEQLERLRQMSCDQAQGYFFARPRAADIVASEHQSGHGYAWLESELNSPGQPQGR